MFLFTESNYHNVYNIYYKIKPAFFLVICKKHSQDYISVLKEVFLLCRKVKTYSPQNQSRDVNNSIL